MSAPILSLLPYNSQELEMVLSEFTKIYEIANSLYCATENNERDGIHVLDFKAMKAPIYERMLGLKIEDIKGNVGDSYLATYSDRGLNLSGPGKFRGPMDECVESVILDLKLSASEKHELLKTIMLDILKVHTMCTLGQMLFKKN